MKPEEGHWMSRVVIAAVCSLTFLAFPVSAWAGEPTAPEAPRPAEEAMAHEAPASAAATPASVVTGEVGGGQTKPSPSSGTSSFFYQRVAGRWSPTRKLELAATIRATEDLARSPDAGSIYRTTGDVVLYGGLSGSYDLSDHFTLTLGVNGSPSSQREIGTSVQAARPNGTASNVDAAVRSRINSVGGLFEVGYDSASDEEHAVDVAIDVSAAATRLGTEQSVIAPDPAARGTAPRSAALAQGRLGTMATVTILANTDLSLDAAYFVYDQGNPGDVGLFTAAAANGQTTSFGAGLPMLPARFTLRPEIGERVGRVSLSAFYQYASLAVDQATGHSVGGRAQISVRSVKLFVGGSYRSDVFPDATAATWTAGAGASFRL